MADNNYDPHLDDAPTRRELQEARFFEQLSDRFDRANPDLIDQSDLVTTAAKEVISEHAQKGDPMTWMKSKPNEFVNEVAGRVRERISSLVERHGDGDGYGPTTGISGGGSGDLQVPSTLGSAVDDDADDDTDDKLDPGEVRRYGETGARTRAWQRKAGLI